jgi:hypothetical protein
MSKSAQRQATRSTEALSTIHDQQAATPAIADDSAVETEDSRMLKHEVARYIVQMTNELSGMARSANMELLAYFLDMSRVEANVQLQRNET